MTATTVTSFIRVIVGDPMPGCKSPVRIVEPKLQRTTRVGSEGSADPDEDREQGPRDASSSIRMEEWRMEADN